MALEGLIGPQAQRDFQTIQRLTRENKELRETLRDKFAMHAPCPGQLEISKVAGVIVRDYCGPDKHMPEYDDIPWFIDWYNTLTIEEQLQLNARVQYLYADAMLKVREEGGGESDDK